MPLPQHITEAVGGTVFLDLQERPSAAPTLTAMQDNGTIIADGVTATLDGVDTTLNGATAKGATQITLNDNSSVVPGQEIWFSDDAESALVRIVDPLVVGGVYLQRPLLKAHADATPVQGTRASYAITAGQADTTFWDGRVQWTVDGVIKWTSLECTLYPLDRVANAQDLFDENPKFADAVDCEEEQERSLDAAHRHVLSLIGAKGRVRVFTGSEAFKDCTVLAWWKRHYRRMKGEANGEMFGRYKNELDEEIARTVETTPRDLNQDGIITESEKMSFNSVKLARR